MASRSLTSKKVSICVRTSFGRPSKLSESHPQRNRADRLFVIASAVLSLYGVWVQVDDALGVDGDSPNEAVTPGHELERCTDWPAAGCTSSWESPASSSRCSGSGKSVVTAVGWASTVVAVLKAGSHGVVSPLSAAGDEVGKEYVCGTSVVRRDVTKAKSRVLVTSCRGEPASSVAVCVDIFRGLTAIRCAGLLPMYLATATMP